MAPAARLRGRPHVSLDTQLQQLILFSDLDAESENLEQLGPIIKSLDEAGQSDAFLKRLRDFVAEKESEIEAVCNENYQDFVSAVDKLLKVRSGTVSIKHRIGELNEELQAGGQSLSSKKKQLLETRRVAQNVDEAIETLQQCLRVLDMANRIESLIEAKKHYAALRLLDDLQNVHLKPILHHDLARHMIDAIPLMRDQVRHAVTQQMKEWLYEVRQRGGQVGKLALDAMEARQKRWRVKSSKDELLSLAKVNSPIELVLNEKVEYNFVDNDHVRIDFKPLYQCIHIYDVMNMREQLQANYQDDRRAQANLLLSRGLSFDPHNPTFPVLLQEVVGFFLIEHHVLQTSPPGFRSEQEVDDLWDNMCERVVDIVGIGLRDCQDTNIFVSTKAVIQTFIMTLEGYSFSVTKLNALLLTLFERYAFLLRDRFAKDYQQAVRDTEHQPMVVENHEELGKVLNVCWLKPGDAERLRSAGFPLTLPFSQTYPLCCMDIRHLVDEYYTFSDGFSQYHREIDDILKKTLDELLIQQVSNAIRNSLEKTSNLAQIAQIVVNAEHFKLATTELETLLAALRAPHRGGKLRLDASSHFATSLEMARRRIDSAIASKLAEFYGVSEFDGAVRGDAARREPQEYLGDSVRWLRTMLESVLVLLPHETRLGHYRTAFQHMADELLVGTLLDREVPALSVAALRGVGVDVEFLRQEATKVEPGLASVCDEAAQTIRLVVEDGVFDYVTSAAARRERFARVQPARAAGLLERAARFYAGTDEAAAARRSRERDQMMRFANRR